MFLIRMITALHFIYPDYFKKFVNSKRRIAIYFSHVYLNVCDSSADIETWNLLAEYFRRHFSIVDVALIENYAFEIRNSISIPP